MDELMKLVVVLIKKNCIVSIRINYENHELIVIVTYRNFREQEKENLRLNLNLDEIENDGFIDHVERRIFENLSIKK